MAKISWRLGGENMKPIKGMNPSNVHAVSRRSLLKGTTVVAGAAALNLHFPAVHAAGGDVVKIGWVAAMSGPGALFGEPVEFVR
eukprot:gene57943-79381_t